MRSIDLKEHESSDPKPLSPTERDALQQADLGIDVTPAPGRDGEYILRPGSKVGAVEVGGMSVRIEPKLGIRQALSLACYAIEKVTIRPEEFDFPETSALPDVLAQAFASSARRTFARGLLHGYRSEEEALLTVRGRIRFDEQLRRRPGMPLPVEVRYDEFTDDVLANRLVKAAAWRLRGMHFRSPKARASLAWTWATLDGVSLCEWPRNAVPDVTFDRLSERYRQLVALSRLILRHGEYEHNRGDVRASGFLMNMNAVFQEFVTVALRESLGLTTGQFGLLRVPTLDKEPRPGAKGSVGLEPDLVWEEGGRAVFVGDAKYKNLAASPDSPPSHAPNADLYQMLAYTTALNLPGGLLIYAKGEADEQTYAVRHAGKRLHVVALDLKGSLQKVLCRVGKIAERVRQLKAEAETPTA